MFWVVLVETRELVSLGTAPNTPYIDLKAIATWAVNPARGLESEVSWVAVNRQFEQFRLEAVRINKRL